MRVLLTTLNSKYVHSNLALKYLYTVVCNDFSQVDIKEFTINNDLNYIYDELVRANYDMVCFSCYIWNIAPIKEICADLKLANPNIKIVLGGPEVSFRAFEFMEENPWVDYILEGEGEYEFYRFCQVICSGKLTKGELDTVPGLSYRLNNKIYMNGNLEPMDFNLIPFPYSVLDCESDKVVYYETTRGCPFRCSYCMSSIDKTVRPLNLDRVKREIGYFLYKKVMQVKFIDRTFNFDLERAKKIISYIIEKDNGVTNFHFEICADLIDEQLIEILGSARKGLFQLEIGIQTTHEPTLREIRRRSNVKDVLKRVKTLTSLGNLHVHVDLIAGLPLETYEIFKTSFNDVYDLKSECLQLGFLKVLKGTYMETQAKEHKIIYRKHPPYEVISTAYVSPKEMVKLKSIENMVDIYYNRGGYMGTLDFLISKSKLTYFDFYEKLADFYYGKGYHKRDRKKDDQYRILAEFSKELALESNAEITYEETILKLDEDYRINNNPEIYKRFKNKGWELK